jgi:anti-sigma-K factor RskA
MSTDEDRIGYLAGETTGGLDADEQAELDDLQTLLADPSLWVEPPSGLEDAVVAAIGAEAVGTVVPFDRASRRRRPPYLFAGVAAAAAAVIIAVGVVATTGNGGDDGVSIALGPTELVPGAHGSARVVPEDSGLRISLDATGLPRRDNGLFYQAWLRNEAGVLIPVGTFHDAEDVTLWAGVSLDDYPTLTITEEVADGDQASSGRRVLVGTVGE